MGGPLLGPEPAWCRRRQLVTSMLHKIPYYETDQIAIHSVLESALTFQPRTKSLLSPGISAAYDLIENQLAPGIFLKIQALDTTLKSGKRTMMYYALITQEEQETLATALTIVDWGLAKGPTLNQRIGQVRRIIADEKI